MRRNQVQAKTHAPRHGKGRRPFPAHLSPIAPADAIGIRTVASGLPTPTGIDYHEPTDTLVMAVNFPDGEPYNLVRVLRDGVLVPFSRLSGVTGSIEIAAVRSPATGGLGGTGRLPFEPGDVFVATHDGIVRITDNGNTVMAGWATLPGLASPTAHASLHVDRTGVWDGDLLAATSCGHVWRIGARGAVDLVADLKVSLRGVATLPDDPLRYGGLAGKLLAGNETNGRIYAIDPGGDFRFWTVTDELSERVDIADIALVASNENLFAADFVTGRVAGCAADALAPLNGEILLTDYEFPYGASGLYRLAWDFVSIRPIATRVPLTGDTPDDWETVSFAPVGLGDLLPPLPLAAN